jgi:hypothetical protein
MGSTRFLIIAAAVVLALGCYAPMSLTQGHTTSTKQSDEADRGENAACAMDASVKRSFSEANVPSATSSTNFSYTCSTLLIVCISELLIVRIRGCSKLRCAL